MPDKVLSRERYGEAFWRKHHEAWQQSALNQREYCEAHWIPLKAFGNWRAKFKAEPQLPAPKLSYRRRSLKNAERRLSEFATMISQLKFIKAAMLTRFPDSKLPVLSSVRGE